MAIDGDNGASTVGGGNTGYNWSGYAEWLAKTKNSTKTCNLIVNYYANGYNGSAAENPPPSSVRSYTGQSVDVRLVVEVASGDTMSNPGYIFVGWATSNNTPTITYNPGDTISNSWAADYRGNSITNLYAVWTNQNVITYNPDDNSIEKSAIYQVKQSGQSATLKGATFTRTGYTQTGWATTAGGPKAYDLGGTYSSNNPLSLYPVWQANTYTITYVANEGTGTMADQTVTYDSTFTPRACSFTREGYSFSSWNESQDGKGIRWKVQEYTVDRAENITLYAIWKGNEYTVYYDDNYSRYSDEITGDVVTFESEYAQPLKKAEVSLSPIQDLHGYANPWIGTDYDQQPYNFRAVSSSSVSPLGNSEMGSIVGGTVAWNQLVENGNFANTTGWFPQMGSISAANNELTYTVSTIGVNFYDNQLRTSAYPYAYNIPKDHVVLLSCETYAPYSNGFYMSARTNQIGQGGVGISNVTLTPNVWNKVSKIAKLNNTLTDIAFYWSMNTTYQVGDSAKLRNVIVIDLTAMFGSTIADYLYTLESGTAGAGVAKLKSWGFCTKPYYAYDAGSLQSVNTSAHKTVGFNQWDEEWEAGTINSSGVPVASTNTIRSKNFCKVIGGATYYARSSKTDGGNSNIYYLLMVFYDADKNFISKVASNNYTFTAPTNAAYFKLHTNTSTVIYGNTYLHDICINLHWDGERDGEYEPYEANTYALDDVELRGIPKLDASNNLYYDGDTYASDGTVTRKYGSVDLGTLSWTRMQLPAPVSDESYAFRAQNFAIKNFGLCVCSKYPYVGAYLNLADNRNGDKNCGYIYGSNFCIRDDAYTDAAAFKTAMSGVYLVYELATPTTEIATAYAATQSIDPDGTEEYVDYAESQGTRDVAIPVGHYTNYANICPISGRTGLSVYRTGVNVWDESYRLASLNLTTGTWGSIGTYSQIASTNMIPVMPNAVYYFNSSNSDGMYIAEYRADGSYIGYVRAWGTNRAITIPADCHYVMFQMNHYGTTYNHDISINYPSTDHDYHAYQGNTYSVDWTSEAGTVYGGTLDVVMGVLTINKAYAVLNNPDKWVESDTNEYRYEVMFTDRKLTGDSYTGLLCSYTGIGPNSGRWVGANNYKFLIRNLSKTLAQVKQDAMDGNIAICYELATPLTYQLTPTQVEALVGTNNVWSDGGPITIVYALDEVPQNMPPSTAIFGDIFYTRRNQLSRFGLTFKGWNTVPDGSGEAWLPSGVSMGTYKRTEDAVWNVSHNVTLYAQWDPNVYPFGTVFFNGRNAQDLGIIVEELPSYYYAERAFNHKQVNGKNGDVILDTGRYENVKKVYKVACYDPSRNFYESAVALSTFLHSAGSDYIRLEDSYEPSSYRMAIYEETNEIENLLGKAGRCEITFNCMPQRFLLSGDEEITVPSSGYSIYNPTAFDAKPMIRIQGTGTVTINGRSVQVTENDNDMLVDCENQNAKDLSGADMNYFIYCDEFPILKPGFNTISYTETIDAVKITPRWWIL